eukprot:scaffold219776_cov20-Prasinocladus_malaysianus.AAC.1
MDINSYGLWIVIVGFHGMKTQESLRLSVLVDTACDVRPEGEHVHAAPGLDVMWQHAYRGLTVPVFLQQDRTSQNAANHGSQILRGISPQHA